MPGMSRPGTAALSFAIPAASLPGERGEKSAVCLFSINLHALHGAGRTRSAGLQENPIKAGLQGGSPAPEPPPVAASRRGRRRAGGAAKVLNPPRGAKSKPLPPPPSLFHERRARRSCKCENFLRSQHSKGKVIFSWLRPLIANARRSLGVCLVKKHRCPLAAPAGRLRKTPQVEPRVQFRTRRGRRGAPRGKSRHGRMEREEKPERIRPETGKHPWMAARGRGMNE